MTQQENTTQANLRCARLSEFEAERVFARSDGMATDVACTTDLEAEVTELAMLRPGG